MAKAKKTNGRKPAARKVDDVEVIQLDKLGKVMTWKLRRQPAAIDPRDVAAYQLGFRARTQDWLQGKTEPTVVKFPNVSKRRAFEFGYADAQMQELEP